jgi:AraC-like DNA-binding protein
MPGYLGGINDCAFTRDARARELLLRGVPIADVSAAVGHVDQNHFTHRLKRLLGMTLGKWHAIA